jgi:hypothetical protein
VDVPALTRSYLQAAGHPPELADAVPALTRGMTTRNSFERLFTGGGLRW